MPKPKRYYKVSARQHKKRIKQLDYHISRSRYLEKVLQKVVDWAKIRENIGEASENMEVRFADAILYAEILNFIRAENARKAERQETIEQDVRSTDKPSSEGTPLCRDTIDSGILHDHRQGGLQAS